MPRIRRHCAIGGGAGILKPLKANIKKKVVTIWTV
jgi:hypothetical protein